MKLGQRPKFPKRNLLCVNVLDQNSVPAHQNELCLAAVVWGCSGNKPLAVSVSQSFLMALKESKRKTYQFCKAPSTTTKKKLSQCVFKRTCLANKPSQEEHPQMDLPLDLCWSSCLQVKARARCKGAQATVSMH